MKPPEPLLKPYARIQCARLATTWDNWLTVSWLAQSDKDLPLLQKSVEELLRLATDFKHLVRAFERSEKVPSVRPEILKQMSQLAQTREEWSFICERTAVGSELWVLARRRGGFV